MLLLTDTESLAAIIKDGMDPKVIPTPAFRGVYDWSVNYYRASGIAPTVEVVVERFGNLLSDAGLDPHEDVEESVEWAIEDLKQSFIQMEIGLFSRRLATEVGTALPEERVETAANLSAELSAMILSLQPKTTHVDLRASGPEILAEYQTSLDSQGQVRGAAFGLPEIDRHMGGIWDGELCVMGGPPGTGKSFFADLVAYNEWERGRSVCLYTLENSIVMTQMRLACMALKMDINRLQQGTLTDEERARLTEWCNDVLVKSDIPMNVISPSTGMRSPQALVQTAKAFEAESLIIDQLTFMRPVKSHDSKPREIGEMMHQLKEMISTGRTQMGCLLMHQINREGVKAAAKTGRLDMSHMAEGAEVERTGDHVMTLYASEEHKRLGYMQIQTLKVRRTAPKHWDLLWAPYAGSVMVKNEVDFSTVLGAEPA